MEKHEKVLSAFSNTFTSLLQYLMAKANYDVFEREPSNKKFLEFKQFVLIQILRYIKHLKKTYFASSLSDEEAQLEERLKSDESKMDPKMLLAINLFLANFPLTFSQVMRNANFSAEECKENSETYIALLGKGLLILHGGAPVAVAATVSTISTSNYINKTTERKRKEEIGAPFDFLKSRAKVEKSQLTNGSVELVTKTKKHLIFRVKHSSGHVALKALKSKSPLNNDIKKLNNEFQIGRMISHPAFRCSINKRTYQGKKALQLEWVHGRALSTASDEEKFTIPEFLNLAREIVSALLSMHKQCIMHLGLTCKHIIYDKDSNIVKIIGYGSATIFGSKLDYISTQELQEIDLRCVSPEQTGMMNRDVDYRSDFYSLGVIFYRILTGKYPFDSDNVLKLIRMHISQEALAVSSVNKDVPQPISKMISKLMEKDALKRYQSAKGIIHDIDLMLSEYKNDHGMSSIVLSQHDYPETLLFSHKLYGRIDEFKNMKALFDRLSHNGFEVCFVHGKSGVGKSSLVNELQQHVLQKGGIYCYGKFHESKMQPYSALLEAINNFCDNILLQNKDVVKAFKSRIQQAVGDEGKILTDLISNLSQIIGDQEVVNDTYGKESKHRFNYVFLKFMRAICSNDLPVIIVLDDLQHIDSDTQVFLSILLQDKMINNVMVIGTYRFDEVDEDHLVMKVIKDAKKHEVKLSIIELKAFNEENVNDIISNVLNVSQYESYSLTAFIYKKTLGNPFFLTQVMLSMFEQGKIYFCHEEFQWKWNVSGETKADDVIELLRRKISTFSEGTKNALVAASCLGSIFSLVSLKYIVNCEKSIHSALSTGMIIPHKGDETTYCFSHDMIQQAAFSLVTDETSTLFYFGNKLLSTLTPVELKKHMFVVANLLFHTSELVSDQDSRLRIAKIFLETGKQSLKSTAFSKSLQLVEKGIKLLGFKLWQIDYSLGLELYHTAMEAVCSLGDKSKANSLLNEISNNVASPLDLVHSKHMQIKLYNDLRLYESSIKEAVAYLSSIGVDISQTKAMEDINEAKRLLDGRRTEELSSLGKMEDRKGLASIVILYAVSTSCFFINPQLFCAMASRMVKLTIEQGLSKYCAIGFSSMGLILSDKDSDASLKFGKFALAIQEITGTKVITPLIHIAYYSSILPYHESIHFSLKPLKESYQKCLENGDIEVSIMAVGTYVNFSYFTGRNLKSLLCYIEEKSEELIMRTPTLLAMHQSVINLRAGSFVDPSILVGDEFDYRNLLKQNRDQSEIARCLIFCFILGYFYGNKLAAYEFLEKCRPLTNFISSTNYFHQYIFYDGLISIALERQSGKREKFHQKIEKSMKRMKEMSERAPENFLNKYYLLQAELATINKRKDLAKKYFDHSISLSSQYDYPHEEALACEKAGEFMIELKNFSEASSYLEKAFRQYLIWGADAKADQLFIKYKSLLKERDKIIPTLLETVDQECSQASVSQITGDTSMKSREIPENNKRVRIK